MPLENRVDYLSLASGQKFQVPFEQLTMFSTNLDPKDLVDDAFLRRMRHKVEITAPARRHLREDLQQRWPSKLGMNPCPDAIDYLYERYYNRGRMPAGQRLPRFAGDGAVDLPISKDTCPIDARPHGRSRRELHPRIQVIVRWSEPRPWQREEAKIVRRLACHGRGHCATTQGVDNGLSQDPGPGLGSADRALAGCQHDMRMIPPRRRRRGPAASRRRRRPRAGQTVPPNAVVKQEADLPKQTPHAATCVAGGDFFAQQALAPDLGETARQSNQEKARKAYQQAMTIDPHCLPAYESLAQLYVAMKDHTHAVATYRKAAQMFPNEARVFYELGMLPRRREGVGPGRPNLAHAAQLDPENRPYVDALGWMQARAGRFDDSLATFRRFTTSRRPITSWPGCWTTSTRLTCAAAPPGGPERTRRWTRRSAAGPTQRRAGRHGATDFLRGAGRSRGAARRRRRTTRRRPRMASSCRRRRGSPSAMRAPRPCRNPATRRPLRGMRPTKTHHSGERGRQPPDSSSHRGSHKEWQ